MRRDLLLFVGAVTRVDDLPDNVVLYHICCLSQEFPSKIIIGVSSKRCFINLIIIN